MIKTRIKKFCHLAKASGSLSSGNLYTLGISTGAKIESFIILPRGWTTFVYNAGSTQQGDDEI